MNGDPNKYGYSGYSIEFDARSRVKFKDSWFVIGDSSSFHKPYLRRNQNTNRKQDYGLKIWSANM